MANSKIEKKVSGSQNDRIRKISYYSYNIDSSIPDSTEHWNTMLYFADKNSKELGSLNIYNNDYDSTNLIDKTGVQLESIRVVNNERINNFLRMSINNNGEKSIQVSSPAAWRNAINAVNKAGDTITGQLTIQQNGIWIQGGSATGSNNSRMTLSYGLPTDIGYYSNKRGTFIYSNGIAFSDPYNGTGNNDGGWMRFVEETKDAGYLEIGVGDGGNETICVRQYNTVNAINRQLILLDSNGHTTIPGSIYGKAIHLFPSVGGSFNEGIRIHPYSNWSTITLCGADNTGDTGTSANTWVITNNAGNFLLARNGSTNATTYLKCINDVWTWNGTATGNISGTASNVTGTIAIDHGGTGATSAQVACRNLKSWVTSQGTWTGGKSSVTFTLNNGTWNCGLVIGNTNGGGNFLYYVQLHNANTVYLDRISTSTAQAGTITASLSGTNLTFTASGSTTIKYITLVGLII